MRDSCGRSTCADCTGFEPRVAVRGPSPRRHHCEPAGETRRCTRVAARFSKWTWPLWKSSLDAVQPVRVAAGAVRLLDARCRRPTVRVPIRLLLYAVRAPLHLRRHCTCGRDVRLDAGVWLGSKWTLPLWPFSPRRRSASRVARCVVCTSTRGVGARLYEFRAVLLYAVWAPLDRRRHVRAGEACRLDAGLRRCTSSARDDVAVWVRIGGLAAGRAARRAMAAPGWREDGGARSATASRLVVAHESDPDRVPPTPTGAPGVTLASACTVGAATPIPYTCTVRPRATRRPACDC